MHCLTAVNQRCAGVHCYLLINRKLAAGHCCKLEQQGHIQYCDTWGLQYNQFNKWLHPLYYPTNWAKEVYHLPVGWMHVLQHFTQKFLISQWWMCWICVLATVMFSVKANTVIQHKRQCCMFVRCYKHDPTPPTQLQSNKTHQHNMARSNILWTKPITTA